MMMMMIPAFPPQTRSSTNRARCRLNSLIETNAPLLRQTTTQVSLYRISWLYFFRASCENAYSRDRSISSELSTYECIVVPLHVR